jgi:integrase
VTEVTQQGTRGLVPRRRARKPIGVARIREPIKDRQTALWRARYVDLEGVVRRCGRFKTKGAARERSTEVVADLNRNGAPQDVEQTFNEFLEDWPRRFPRQARTESTNLHRIKHYIVPYLPREGELPIDGLRRAHLLDVQDELLRKRLAKTTIDGAFTALSAMLRDALELEVIEANLAAGLRVKPNDPRLDPKRGSVSRRSVPPDEIHRFIAKVAEGHRATCWTPTVTGVRPGELFAMQRPDLDRRRRMIYLHQTVDRYGRLMNGLKGTHHIAEKEKRGRWTLFPSPLLELLNDQATNVTGFLFTSPRGKLWCARNFYRDVWSEAQKDARVKFTLYDLRHTFASRLLAAGIPVVEVAAWMGHSVTAGGEVIDAPAISNTTTRIYAHATGEWRGVALRVLAELMNQRTSARRRRPRRVRLAR